MYKRFIIWISFDFIFYLFYNFALELWMNLWKIKMWRDSMTSIWSEWVMGLSGEDRTWDQLQMMTKLALPLGSGANIPHESQLIRVLSYFMYVNNFNSQNSMVHVLSELWYDCSSATWNLKVEKYCFHIVLVSSITFSFILATIAFRVVRWKQYDFTLILFNV